MNDTMGSYALIKRNRDVVLQVIKDARIFSISLKIYVRLAIKKEKLGSLKDLQSPPIVI